MPCRIAPGRTVLQLFCPAAFWQDDGLPLLAKQKEMHHG